MSSYDILCIMNNNKNIMKNKEGYLNPYLKQFELNRKMSIHHDNLHKISESQTQLPFNHPHINNKKRQYMKLNQQNWIQKHNKLLLEKIHSIMKVRKCQSTNQKTKSLRSMNSVQRKKKKQQIQNQNIKMYKRVLLQESAYNQNKINKSWKKSTPIKNKISNMTLNSFQIRNNLQQGNQENNKSKVSIKSDQYYSIPIQIRQTRIVDGFNLYICIKLDKKVLLIRCEELNSNTGYCKMIEIPREIGIQFIRSQCENRIQKIFEKLKYNGNTLYLVGNTHKQSKIQQIQSADNELKQLESDFNRAENQDDNEQSQQIRTNMYDLDESISQNQKQIGIITKQTC